MSRFSRRPLLGALIALSATVVTVLPATSAPASPAPVPHTAQARGSAPVVTVEKALAEVRPSRTQRNASVAWNGRRFLVVWEEATATGVTQIYGTRVSRDGKVLNPRGIRLSLSENDHANPTVIGGGGRFLVVWEERPEGTYSDLGAALLGNAGPVERQWTLSSADNGQTDPVGAWNGRFFVVAWEDEPDPDDADVYAARVLPDGLTLDGCSSDACPDGDDPGLRLGVAAGTDQTSPSLVRVSRGIVAAWEDHTGPAAPNLDANLLALNGQTYFGQGFDAVAQPGAQTRPVIAAHGDRALLVWTDNRSGNADIYRRPLSTGGWDPSVTPTPTAGTALAAETGSQTSPAITRFRDGFAVVWTDSRSGSEDIRGALLTREGEITGAAPILAGGPRIQQDPAIASGPGRALLVYHRDSPALEDRERVYFRFLS